MEIEDISAEIIAAHKEMRAGDIAGSTAHLEEAMRILNIAKAENELPHCLRELTDEQWEAIGETLSLPAIESRIDQLEETVNVLNHP